MRGFAKFLTAAGIIVAVLAVGVLVGWLGTRVTPAPRSPPMPISSAKSTSTNLGFFPPNIRKHEAGSATNRVSIASSGSATNLVADWEDKLDVILGAEGAEAQKARQLLELFPRLPPDGQVEVAQHLSNLVSDQDYAPLGKLLTDVKLPEEVLDVLMMDLLNRPNALKLPLLLEVARDPQHPKAGEAKDLLELYLEQDYGSDWNTWQARLQQWMRDNPD